MRIYRSCMKKSSYVTNRYIQQIFPVVGSVEKWPKKLFRK